MKRENATRKEVDIKEENKLKEKFKLMNSTKHVMKKNKDCGSSQSNMAIFYHCNLQMLITKHNLKIEFEDFPTSPH